MFRFLPLLCFLFFSAAHACDLEPIADSDGQLTPQLWSRLAAQAMQSFALSSADANHVLQAPGERIPSGIAALQRETWRALAEALKTLPTAEQAKAVELLKAAMATHVEAVVRSEHARQAGAEPLLPHVKPRVWVSPTVTSRQPNQSNEIRDEVKTPTMHGKYTFDGNPDFPEKGGHKVEIQFPAFEAKPWRFYPSARGSFSSDGLWYVETRPARALGNDLMGIRLHDLRKRETFDVLIRSWIPLEGVRFSPDGKSLWLDTKYQTLTYPIEEVAEEKSLGVPES